MTVAAGKGFSPGKVLLILMVVVLGAFALLFLFGGQLRHALGGEVLPGDPDRLAAGDAGR